MKLTVAERMNLLKFVCSFVWTDLRVAPSERELVQRIADGFELTAAEKKQVAAWLAVPPPIEEVDPGAVPTEHRVLFLRAAKLAIEADGKVVPAERDAMDLFADLLED